MCTPYLTNRRGFTILELMLASTVLIISMTTVEQLKSYSARLAASISQDKSVIAEHQVLDSMLKNIPLEETESISCPKPHPWYTIKTDPETGGQTCQENPSVKIPYNQSQYAALARSYFALTTSGQVGGQILSVSKTSNFTANISELMNQLQNSGCLSCHNNTNQVKLRDGQLAKRNFSSYEALIDQNSPLVSVFGFGSPLGRRLINQQVAINSSLRNSVSVDQNQTGVVHGVTFEGFSTPRKLRGNLKFRYEFDCRKWTTRNQTGATKVAGRNCSCPGGMVVDCQYVCERVVSGEKKTNVEGCDWYSYYGCIYPPTDNPRREDVKCKHGVLRSYYSPLPLSNTTAQAACQALSPPPVSFSYRGRSYPYRYTYWDCSDPTDLENKFIANQLNVTYNLYSHWFKNTKSNTSKFNPNDNYGLELKTKTIGALR